MSIEFCSNEVLDAFLAVSAEYWVADYRRMKSGSLCGICVCVWFGYESRNYGRMVATY